MELARGQQGRGWRGGHVTSRTRNTILHNNLAVCCSLCRPDLIIGLLCVSLFMLAGCFMRLSANKRCR